MQRERSRSPRSSPGPRRALAALPLAVAGLALACGCAPEEQAAIDHVLLVVVDTLRADHLGSYGHPRSPTPAIDSIAARGVRFAEAYSQCSWTAPSMVSLFTGRYLAEDRLEVPEGLPTLARSFQEAGWATGAFIMNDIVSAAGNFDEGFDEFVQLRPYESNAPILDWIDRNAGGRAFTYVHLNEAHDPYELPEWAGEQHYRDEPDPVSEQRRHYYETVQRDLKLEGDLGREIRAIETEIGGYVDDVAFADARIGELLEALDAHGLTERAAVVITSDHGEGLFTRVAMMSGQRGQHLARGQAPTLTSTLMMTHGNQVNRELLHVPWVLAAPGLPQGEVVDGPVELVDLFPTLLDVVDLPKPFGLQGVSRMPAIEGRAQLPAVAYARTRMASTLITPDGWQLILPTAVGVCEEGLLPALYDLNEDPEARVNKAVDEPEVVAELTEQLEERLRAGIANELPTSLDPDVKRALDALGYTGTQGSATVEDEPPPELMALELGDLVEQATTDEYLPCTERRALARALQARKAELDEDQRAALRGRLESEPFPAVRALLEQVLAAE